MLGYERCRERQRWGGEVGGCGVGGADRLTDSHTHRGRERRTETETTSMKIIELQVLSDGSIDSVPYLKYLLPGSRHRLSAIFKVSASWLPTSTQCHIQSICFLAPDIDSVPYLKYLLPGSRHRLRAIFKVSAAWLPTSTQCHI